MTSPYREPSPPSPERTAQRRPDYITEQMLATPAPEFLLGHVLFSCELIESTGDEGKAALGPTLTR
jgi:hypothetical protein